MSDWLKSNPLPVVAIVLWAAGILWLMPGVRRTSHRPRLPGLLLVVAGVAAFLGHSIPIDSDVIPMILLWSFGGGALVCAVLMITSSNPVYSALWFALVTLCTCGLFVLRNAPFLAAATVIVYAGAVIVTFLFVIMLARQSGASYCDLRARQPVFATVIACVLLLTVMAAIPLSELGTAQQRTAGGGEQAALAGIRAGTLSAVDGDHPAGSLLGLGRSLFSDYLFAVELAGTLLLIASVGAIAIAPRREQGHL